MARGKRTLFNVPSDPSGIWESAYVPNPFKADRESFGWVGWDCWVAYVEAERFPDPELPFIGGAIEVCEGCGNWFRPDEAYGHIAHVFGKD